MNRVYLSQQIISCIGLRRVAPLVLGNIQLKPSCCTAEKKVGGAHYNSAQEIRHQKVALHWQSHKVCSNHLYIKLCISI